MDVFEMVEFHSRWVKVPNADLQIDAYLAEPMWQGPCAAVIVLQEIFGVNAHIREVTERFAREGYVAIAPAIFQRVAPGFSAGYSQADILEGRKYKDQTTVDQLLSDLQATVGYLKAKANVKQNKIGVIGFCFGGHVAYLAATLPDIKATASFYGAGIATMTPGGGPATITRTSDIPGTVYAFFGTQDELIPNEQADQVEAALKQHNPSNQVFRYPTGHGFFCDHRSDFNPEAAADAWKQVKQLFQEKLSGW